VVICYSNDRKLIQRCCSDRDKVIVGSGWEAKQQVASGSSEHLSEELGLSGWKKGAVQLELVEQAVLKAQGR
jgi:putative AlgH/UPF0301 family transcriptional regulator